MMALMDTIDGDMAPPRGGPFKPRRVAARRSAARRRVCPGTRGRAPGAGRGVRVGG